MATELDLTIERHAESAFAFLERLVNAPSTVGQEQSALEVFAEELDSLDFKVTRLPFPTGQPADSRSGIAPQLPSAAPRYQVLGTTPGNRPLTLLLNGHMDVVPAESPALWTTPPFTASRRDGQMFGRGTGDMKGGFALGVLALRALKDLRPQLFTGIRRLGFLAVIEEECTGNGTLLAGSEHGVTADAVVLLEPTDLGVLLGGVGVLWVELEVTGAAAHAESAHQITNPVELGLRIVSALRDWCAALAETVSDPTLREVPSPYNVNLGTVHAGDWTSSVPAVARLSVRIGFPRSWSPSYAESQVREFIASTTANDVDFAVSPRVTTTGLRAAGYTISPQSELVSALAVAHRDAHGETLHTFTMGSTTDARTYLNDFGVPAACYGAVSHNIHGVDESVELQSIIDGARTLARFLLARFEPVTATE
ncbi:MAG: M20/M25/M40 family metallo-hydrolase [Microbacteriaceae bacterium]|nr:M20/M25/M40 family metallo-hydrolase [Microbacteriaceae bacterium]